MSISGHDLRAGTAENYRAFAAEAHGRSALYAELATALRRLVDGRADELDRTMLARRTQTHEPARCATQLPVLALLPEPLALIEEPKNRTSRPQLNLRDVS